jgi:hypothetical protein
MGIDQTTRVKEQASGHWALRCEANGVGRFQNRYLVIAL